MFYTVRKKYCAKKVFHCSSIAQLFFSFLFFCAKNKKVYKDCTFILNILNIKSDKWSKFIFVHTSKGIFFLNFLDQSSSLLSSFALLSLNVMATTFNVENIYTRKKFFFFTMLLMIFFKTMIYFFLNKNCFFINF